MTTARPIFWAIVSALFAGLAAPAAAQDPDMLGELRALCVDDPERQSITLGMTAGPAFAPLVERGVVGWDTAGYLAFARVGEQGPYMTPWHRSFVPLSSVRAHRRERSSFITFVCPDSEDCIFREGNTLSLLDHGPMHSSVPIECRNPERVIQLLDTWIDRNVTRTSGVPPFAE